MPFAKRLLVLPVAAMLLSACDPDYESTSTQCANVPETPVRIAVSDFSVSAGANDYPLYLEDILLAFEPDGSATLTSNQIDARTFVLDKVNSYLDYTTSSGTVTSASNPLDFLEELIATTDDSRVVGAFQEAKNQMGRAIAADDDFCNYTNRNIIVENTTTGDELFVDFSLSYNPFTRIVQQSVLATLTEEALLSSEQRASAPYVGFFQADPAQYSAQGYSQPYLRQAIMNDSSETESFSVDDGFDTRLGVLEFIIEDKLCYPDDDAEKTGDLQACDAGVTTRPVAKSQCEGDPEDAADDGDTNKYAQNFFYLNDDFPEIKRVRVETDYVTQDVRIYLSEYREAIYDSDGVTVIKDPTDCEISAVLQELSDANPDTVVRLTVVDDPGYDITYTSEDADREPIEPATDDIDPYQGQVIPARQEEL